MSAAEQNFAEHSARATPRRFRSSALPHLRALLRIIPRPRWAAFTLVSLGVLSSFAEALGITLIPLFVYSAMGRLDALTANGGLVGAALRIIMRTLHGSQELALLFLLLILIRGALAYVYGVATSHIGERMSEITRNRVHHLYLRLPYKVFQQHEQAELVEVLGREVPLLSSAYTSLTRLLVNLIFMVVFTVFLAVLSWEIMLCAVVGSLILSGFLRLSSGRARAIGTNVRHVHRRMWDHMVITLQGMRTLRAFGQEERQHARYVAWSDTARRAIEQELQLILLLDPLTEAGYLLILGVLIFVAHRFGVSFAVALTSVALLYRLQPHVREMEATRLKLLQLEAQLQPLRQLLEAGDLPLPAEGTVRIDSIQQGVRFEGVTFRYQGDGAPALDDATFSIPAHASTAIVGASGSGKTTIVNLLLRLYEPSLGTIHIDGWPLPELARHDWLSLVGLAGQDVDLIDGTILDNVRLADEDASAETVAAAMAVADSAEMMRQLPEGYDTWVGQQGHRFSGGQRQRIGLARAALRRPQLLILDEAMSAMDMALEQRIREAIRQQFSGRTILLITHRLETVLNADHVVCIDQGRIVAEGTPSELLLDRDSVLSRALAAQS